MIDNELAQPKQAIVLQGSVSRKRTFGSFGNYILLEYIDQVPKIHMVSSKAKNILVTGENQFDSLEEEEEDLHKCNKLKLFQKSYL